MQSNNILNTKQPIYSKCWIQRTKMFFVLLFKYLFSVLYKWKFKFIFRVKRLSIESDNKVMGKGLWRFWGPRDWENFLGPSLSQNRRWHGIQWIFASTWFSFTFPHCIWSGSNSRLVEIGMWGIYQGDIVCLHI